VTLGRAQARALGDASLPIAVIPHPFGSRSREEVREIASRCAEEVLELVTGGAK
jgi:predicted dienelactone hydrolase